MKVKLPGAKPASGALIDAIDDDRIRRKDPKNDPMREIV